MSRCFYWLMQRAGFPYRDCQLTNKLDCLLLQHLKETFCHLDQVRRGKWCLIQVILFSFTECYSGEAFCESKLIINISLRRILAKAVEALDLKCL